MCKDCGCETANKHHHDHHHHDHPHDHDHHHDHSHSHTGKQDLHNKTKRTITIEERVLEKNDRLARSNREWFDQNGILALNIMSSPGSGKTMLLEKTVEIFNKNSSPNRRKLSIITGDQEQDFDAERLRAKGAYVKQLNTPNACHLDADMIHKTLGQFVTQESTDLLIIENVGNLVCPAAFELGEHLKVALLSTTEGEDKPAKYPLLFHLADVILITKTDLIPYLDWNETLCESYIRKVNSKAKILKVSAKTGAGLEAWIDFLPSFPSRVSIY